MSTASPVDLARKYCVDDLPGAATPGTRLQSILETLHIRSRLTRLQLPFLIERKLLALHELATGALTFDAFCPLALAEQEARVAAQRTKMDTEAAERQAQEAALAASSAAFFAKQASDPILQARRESKNLRDRYGLGFIEPDIYRRVMQILKRVDDGQRLSAEEVAWLSTDAEECWSPELRQAYHRLEAEALTAEWHQTGNPWAAVTASGHWRKAEEPLEALKITEAATTKGHLAAKVRSALCTTRGGAMRDLRRLPEALALGQEAQQLAPKDFRPCTLLGAVHIERGDYTAGMEWYERAAHLGATRHAVDQDLRGILARASPAEREQLRSFLLSRDKDRFAWARHLNSREGSSARG